MALIIQLVCALSDNPSMEAANVSFNFEKRRYKIISSSVIITTIPGFMPGNLVTVMTAIFFNILISKKNHEITVSVSTLEAEKIGVESFLFLKNK